MKKRDPKYGTMLVILGAALLVFGSHGVQAAGQSGCVNCHTDEAKLIANVAKTTAKKSAMQAGTG